MKNFYAGGFAYNSQTKSVLLHKRDANTPYNPNMWAFFGGLSKAGESPKQTFIREVKEELGISINQKEVIELCNYFNAEFKTHRYVFYIEKEIKDDQIKLGEGAGYAWVKLSKIHKLDLTEKTEKDLKLFFKSKS